MKYALSLLAAVVAVNASPFPQAVTAAISPSAKAPTGCSASYPSSFGVININVTEATGTSSTKGAKVTQLGDGQPGAGSSTTLVGVTQISDAQPQAPTAVTQISDGQIQGGRQTKSGAVTQISDGQVQGPTRTQSHAVTQIGDGQVQGPTVVPGPATQLSDGQPGIAATTKTASGVSQISDNQPQAPTATSSAGQTGQGSIAFCQTDNTLALTLNNGILKDSKGRTGYIASNYQFQFDSPPQAGAIYTAGFSVCGNGTLSLGGSSIFYQCRSGDFYNLYDRHWAAQCNAIYIQTGSLVKCS